MVLSIRVQIPNEAVYISHSINPPEKVMHSTIPLPSRLSNLALTTYLQKVKISMQTSCRAGEGRALSGYLCPWHTISLAPRILISYRSFKVSSRPDYLFEIPQLWQSDFSRVYSNCCCSCWFEREVIKISLASHKMYSNKILNFQESRTILNACTKIVWNLIESTTYKCLHV